MSSTQQKNIPALRFPEFKGEWEADVVENLAEITTGDKDTKNKEDDGVYPFYVRSDNVERINSYSYDGEAVLTSGDGVGVGKNYHYVTGRFDFHQRVYCIYDFKDKLIGKYFYYYFSKAFYSRVIRLSAKNSVDSVRRNMVSEMLIPLPSTPEQQKIADFLSAVDNRIQQLTRKKELLQQYKKGVMQQLFNQQIRFKDDYGNNYPEWEEKKLGEVYEFYQTNSYSRAMLNYDNGIVKNIHYGDIHTKYKSAFRISKETVPFINHDVDITKIKPDSYCRLKDVIIADASEDYNDIGKAIEVVELNNEKLVAGLHTYIARDKNNYLTLGFGGYLFQSDNLRTQIKKLATGISVLGISKTNLVDVVIIIPSKPEQQKIADYLSSIDAKIAQVNTLIEQTKNFKKGLLQQMFV